MSQLAKRLVQERTSAKRAGNNENVPVAAGLEKQLESLKKWHLWQGNVYRVLQIIEDLERNLESCDARSERVTKLLRFHHDIEANQVFNANCRDRYRH